MKIFALAFLLMCTSGRAATYYFSASQGNDNRSYSEAKNPATPWQSLQKLNTFFSQLQPGDSIVFKRGDVFYGSLRINRSGTTTAPIVFSAYGTGALPVITGFTTLSQFKPTGTKVYEAYNSNLGKTVNMLLIQGKAIAVGRFPNATATNKGFLQFQSAEGKTSVTDSRLASYNFNGGDVVIRKNRWVIDRNKILTHQGSRITYQSQSGYTTDAGFGFFIQNHPAVLDVEGEWYYKPAEKKIGIFSGDTPKNVQVSSVDTLVNIQDQSHLVFTGIAFTGSNQETFLLNNARNITLKNCELLYNGRNAVSANNTSYLTIEQCNVYATNNNGFNGNNCFNTIVRNNTFRNTGAVAGMGDGDAGSYEAIIINGNDNLLQQNILDSTGYIPISFNGNNVTILNNIISNYAMVKDDGGGIYTWNNAPGAAENTNRVIRGNIVYNGIGASAGTADADKKFAHGIYIDDNASNVSVQDNTVYNCAGVGMFVHNSRNLNVNNNTLYNNQVQFTMQHDDIAPNSPVINNKVVGNTFFSLLANQAVAEFKTNNNALEAFGNFANNFYCRPLDENATINTLKKIDGSYKAQQVDLAGWQAMSGKDEGSKGSPKQFAAFKVNRYSGVNQFGNSSFGANIGGLYAFSAANNCILQHVNGTLDQGTLKVSFSSATGNSNKGTIVAGIGAVTANKWYVVRFSLKGAYSNRYPEVYLRKSLAPYNDIASRKLFKVTGNRQEVELLFVATESQANASIGIDIPEQQEPLFIDNLQVNEAEVTVAQLKDSVRLLVNNTPASKKYSLSETYVTVNNTSYKSSIKVDAYSSAILLKSSLATTATNNATCAATGTILLEKWTNVGGNNVADNNWKTAASVSQTIQMFEAPANSGDNYALRIRGYLCPPQTGAYTFWVAGDDATELYLSTDEDPLRKKLIAYNVSWTNAREWNRHPTQKSLAIMLVAGKKYYIEALHKEGGGGDNLAVGWQLPDGQQEMPIAGSRLSPFTLVAATVLKAQTIHFNALQSVPAGSKLQLVANASSGLPVVFKIVSGPATLTGNTLTTISAGTVVIEASQSGDGFFSAAPAVRQSLLVFAQNECSASGNIQLELWHNVNGNNITDHNWASIPGENKLLSVFEYRPGGGENYASRISGFICAPQTGYYTFWIAGDDATSLYLSTDNKPTSKKKIAFSLSWTNDREWSKFASQKSEAVFLQQGKPYYIEALQKQGGGGGSISVGWQLPDGTQELPVPGSRLSPMVQQNKAKGTALAAMPAKSETSLQATDLQIYPNPVNAQSNIVVHCNKACNISLSICNAGGNLINKLYSGSIKEKQSFSIPLHSEALAPGLYVIQLNTGSEIISKKVIIAR